MDNVAQFRFLKHKFIDTQILIDPTRDESGNYQVNLECRTMDNKEAGQMRLDLIAKIADEEKIVDIKVTMSSIFEYDKTLANEEKEKFFKCNAPAIAFPFLRAYVNSLTALSGINPVVLPTFNFSK